MVDGCLLPRTNIGGDVLGHLASNIRLITSFVALPTNS